jgi:tetratricopeptide (TPR) repeat protein
MTSIIDRIKNEEIVPVEDFLKLDENDLIYIIEFCYGDDDNIVDLFNYCIANKNTEDTKIMCALGCLYESGRVTTEANYDKAIKYYKMAVEKGSVGAMHELGHIYCEIDAEDFENDYDEGIKYLKMAIEKGCGKSMFDLGWLYQHGKGVAKNIDVAIKYYKMAVEKGNSDAMLILGDIYIDGKNIEKNFEEAIKYYKMAIEKGDKHAMYDLGKMYQYGNGVDKNFEEAIRYYIMTNNADYFFMCIAELERMIAEINKLSNDEKIKYYRLLNQHKGTKEYARKIIITYRVDDIIQMYEENKKLKKKVEELETHIRYMPDGIGYYEAKEEFESLQQK